MVIRTATWLPHPSKRAITSTFKLQVNNLTIPKALVYLPRHLGCVAWEAHSWLPISLRSKQHTESCHLGLSDGPFAKSPQPSALMEF